MKKYLVAQKFAAFAVALAVIDASPAHANHLKEVAARCADALAGRTAFRGADPVGQWIALPDHDPAVAEVLGADAETLRVGWTDRETMLPKSVDLPRPATIYLARPDARARYDAAVAAAGEAFAARDRRLVGQVARLGRGFGPAKILAASPAQLEIEYVVDGAVERVIVGRPIDIQVVTDVDFAVIARRGRMMRDYPHLVEGAYLAWSPNVMAGWVTDSRLYAGGGIRLFYGEPWDLPPRPRLLDDLKENATFVRVLRVDLAFGTLELATIGGTVILPLRPEILERSTFRPSPVGALDEAPRDVVTGFRRFRDRFLRGLIKPGTAILDFAQTSEDFVRAPRETFAEFTLGRVESVGPDFVAYRMGAVRLVRRGLRELAGLSLRHDHSGIDAEVAVKAFEVDFERRRRTARPAARFDADALARLPFLAQVDRIAAELEALGFPAARTEHYVQRIIRPTADAGFFWTGERPAADEYRRLIRELHAGAVATRSEATRAFAAEVYARATAAARTLRGFSERRSK